MDCKQEMPSDSETEVGRNCTEINTQPADEYAYTEREQFTSEAFKIEIGNIPKYFGFGECKKLLKKKLKLNPHKIKHVPNVGKIYVTFKNEDEKNKALDVLHLYEYKRHVLAVKNAKPKADAMAEKRPSSDASHASGGKRSKIDGEDEATTMSPKETLSSSVTKWHEIPYEDQLTKKYEQMKQFLCTLRQKMGKHDLDHEVFVWMMKHKNVAGGMCCPLHPVLASPVTKNYRNKSEFTVGLNSSGEKTVGYRLGKYRNKTCAVEEADEIVILPEKMKKVASKFQEYVRSSGKDPYDPQSYGGHWRQLTVRITLEGEVMATVITCKKDCSPEEVKLEKDRLVSYFKSEVPSILVSNLLYQTIPTHRTSGDEIDPPEVLFGKGYITEVLTGLKFQISPDAFFQCNTLAAEVLYTTIAKYLKEEVTETKEDVDDVKVEPVTSESKKNVLLYDICCGTGTIGLTLASTVKHVVGIELCEQAVEDAKRNAKINGIENVEFHCGKAEDLLPSLIKRHRDDNNEEIVAIVDPPRPGLHSRVVQCLRRCPLLRKIIYVSCNPNSAMNNFVDLCRPMSKRMPGLPFLPLVAQPVDLFPHTPHCELIVVFRRIADKSDVEQLPGAERAKDSQET